MSNATRVASTKTPITLDSIAAMEFQKAGTVTAQLRQVITNIHYYPSKKVDSELNGGLFSAADFGFHEQAFPSTEERVAWILIPVGMDEATVLAQLAVANVKGGCIYRVLSNAPIISKDQQYSIDRGFKTLDDYADAQVMRYPVTDKTTADGTAGKLILNKGIPQYRKTFFWGTPKADVDMRGNGTAYVSDTIADEMTAGADTFAGQEVQD